MLEKQESYNEFQNETTVLNFRNMFRQKLCLLQQALQKMQIWQYLN